SPSCLEHLDLAAQDVARMLPGIRPGVLLIDRFDGHAVAAEPPDVMTPPRRRPGNRSASRVAGLKQGVESPCEPAAESLRRVVVNASVHLDHGRGEQISHEPPP